MSLLLAYSKDKVEGSSRKFRHAKSRILGFLYPDCCLALLLGLVSFCRLRTHSCVNLLSQLLLPLFHSASTLQRGTMTSTSLASTANRLVTTTRYLSCLLCKYFDHADIHAKICLRFFLHRFNNGSLSEYSAPFSMTISWRKRTENVPSDSIQTTPWKMTFDRILVWIRTLSLHQHQYHQLVRLPGSRCLSPTTAIQVSFVHTLRTPWRMSSRQRL